MRKRLAILTGAAGDVRDSVRRARARRRSRARQAPERHSTGEVKRRLDETRERLKSEISPPPD